MAKEKKKKEGMKTGLVPWGRQVHTLGEIRLDEGRVLYSKRVEQQLVCGRLKRQ